MENQTFNTLRGIVTFKPGYGENLVAGWSDDRLYRELMAFKKAAKERGDTELAGKADEYQDRMLTRL